MPAYSELQIAQFRADFPLLSKTGRNGEPIAYLDYGATSQKPKAVLDALETFYTSQNGAVARGTHLLADEATWAFDSARKQIANFLGANSSEELCWTKNATEALNLVALACDLVSTGVKTDPKSPFFITTGDKIVVSPLEHHSNLLPWQRLCQRTGATLDWLDLTDDGRLDLQSLGKITEETKIVALTHVSNVTGAISNIEKIKQRARAQGALIVLDTCQSSAHMPINLQDLDVDFAVFSSHKMLGPTGIGALWGKAELLEQMPPILLGGSMVETVYLDHSTFLPPPLRFEAGSQAVAQAVGWAKACEYLAQADMSKLAEHEHELGVELLEQMSVIPGIKLLGPKNMDQRCAVFAFEVKGVHPHDVGQFLDASSIAVRVGHHCAQPIHHHFSVASSTRASLGLTTTKIEISRFVKAMTEVRSFFGVDD